MLKYKLFKWFAALVLVFGAMSAFFGIWVISQRVVHEAQTRVRFDLSSAWAVYQSKLSSLETIARLVAVRGPLVEACNAQKWQDKAAWADIQGFLGKAQLDFGLDFVTVVSPDGQVVVRTCPPYYSGDYRTIEPIVAKALAGTANSDTVLLSKEELAREASGLVERAFLPLQETPHARPSPKTNEDRGMVMLAAAPIEKNGRVVGALYAGILLNRNDTFVDRVHNVVFGQDMYHGKLLGTVTLFLGDTRVATTVRLDNGNRAIGTRVSKEVADRVLENGEKWLDRAFVLRDWYLTAYDPIRDRHGHVIGMLYVGTLEQPYRDASRAMLLRYSAMVAIALLVAMLIAMFIAGRVARPLHHLAEEADKMRHGHKFEPVPLDRACVETAGLIQAFNEMATTIVRREQELKEANEHLAGANESLKALNAHYMETLQFVSHELNSPLSSITNYAYMLRQKLLGPLTEKQEASLDVITANLKRVMEMIRHYLNLARIESGEIQPTPARVAVREDIISPILTALQNDINAKHMRVEDLIGPKTILHTDPNMTREVFENLLSNAIKYGREGGLITLNYRPNGQMAEFTVRNEGDGIPAERRGELFQKFSRIELGGPKKATRGTGLGLFICKQIVERHGGTISVDSQVGQWTEFRLTLPLAREAPAPDSAAVTAAKTG